LASETVWLFARKAAKAQRKTGGLRYSVFFELGSAAVEDRFHVKHLHATTLHQLGLDPNRLSYFFKGLDQKLVGVEEVEPIEQVL
jgi:hypothetical protein